MDDAGVASLRRSEICQWFKKMHANLLYAVLSAIVTLRAHCIKAAINSMPLYSLLLVFFCLEAYSFQFL